MVVLGFILDRCRVFSHRFGRHFRRYGYGDFEWSNQNGDRAMIYLGAADIAKFDVDEPDSGRLPRFLVTARDPLAPAP